MEEATKKIESLQDVIKKLNVDLCKVQSEFSAYKTYEDMLVGKRKMCIINANSPNLTCTYTLNSTAGNIGRKIKRETTTIEFGNYGIARSFENHAICECHANAKNERYVRSIDQVAVSCSLRRKRSGPFEEIVGAEPNGLQGGSI